MEAGVIDPRAHAYGMFLSSALTASRANFSWPDLRTLGSYVAAMHPNVHEGAGPPFAVDPETGLLRYEVWARVKADQTVAHDNGKGDASSARGGRRAYHQALRALPRPRLGDIDIAVRSTSKGTRKLHVVLDKIEANGCLVRLTADVTVGKALDDRAFQDLLFPMTSLPIELTLVRMLAASGVIDVERVTRGAVDLCACVAADVVPAVLERLATIPDAAVCALSFSTCALDVTPGDNDLFDEDSAFTAEAFTPERALADSARKHLGGRELPHRLFRDRKLVVSQTAYEPMRKRADANGKKTVIYKVPA